MHLHTVNPNFAKGNAQIEHLPFSLPCIELGSKPLVPNPDNSRIPKFARFQKFQDPLTHLLLLWPLIPVETYSQNTYSQESLFNLKEPKEPPPLGMLKFRILSLPCPPLKQEDGDQKIRHI